jgi:hypothetical protein
VIPPLAPPAERMSLAVQEQMHEGETTNGQPQEPEPKVESPMHKGAHFSPDRLYRYALWRDWSSWSNMRTLVVIGLNPSTADENDDDPTIRRCIGFAKREQCGRLVMLNLFALRATDPRVMKAHPEPIGPDNDAVIRHWTRDEYDWSSIVVAAWGVHGAHMDRAMAARLLTPQLYCFGVTKDGHPRHPLYLRADTPLVRYPLTERAPVLAVDRSRSIPQSLTALALTPSPPAERERARTLEEPND